MLRLSGVHFVAARTASEENAQAPTRLDIARKRLPGGGWEPIDASRLTITLPPPYVPLEVNRYLIQKDRDMQVVLYWYQAQGHALASELSAKIGMVRSALMSRRTDGALVRASSPVTDSVVDTTTRLVRYVQALYPVLGEYLPD